MCGIVGVWSPNKSPDALRQRLEPMRDALLHRGPDSADSWFDSDGGLALGHRRLAIVDLTDAGRQPMVSEDGRFVLTFNGEIYNHRSMRRSLESHGATFRGDSDTEVLLEWVAVHGVRSAVEHANGQFAFGVWDRHERTLSLARDRLGINPLLYGVLGGDLVFASELRSFRVHPDCPTTLNPAAVESLIRTGCIAGDLCILEGVRKLAPGSLAVFRQPDSPPDVDRFWDARSVAISGSLSPFVGSASDAVDALDALLRDSIGLRRVADVPLGAFLSGGVDSSTVVALMQENTSAPVRTFSIGFSDARYDEGKDAERVARHLGTEHTALQMDPSHAMALVPELTRLTDEPFADVSLLPTYLVSRMARESVTVALSGDGGDELFAGYNRHVWGPRVWAFLSRIPVSLRTQLGLLLNSIPTAAWDRVYAALPGTPDLRMAGQKVHKLGRVFGSPTPEALYDLLRDQWIGELPVRQSWYRPRMHDIGLGLSERMMLMDLATYLHEDILTKVDRASMAVSLESRVPLLDHRVVEFAWSLPLEHKLRNGISKWVLRQVLYRRVPRELIERPKMGFTLPLDEWLRHDLRDWADGLLMADDLTHSPSLDAGPIRRLWKAHVDRTVDAAAALWPVLALQDWLRQKA